MTSRDIAHTGAAAGGAVIALRRGHCDFLFFVYLARCQRVKRTKYESTQTKTPPTFMRAEG